VLCAISVHGHERLAVEMGVQHTTELHKIFAELVRYIPVAVALIVAAVFTALILASRYPSGRSSFKSEDAHGGHKRRRLLVVRSAAFPSVNQKWKHFRAAHSHTGK
jgi:hypothetical protein